MVDRGGANGDGSETPTDGTADFDEPLEPVRADGGSALSEQRREHLQGIAETDGDLLAILSVMLSPFGYYMVGRTKLAMLNLLTINYLLLGVAIVPLHTWKIHRDARAELERHGEDW
jgi:hypothetical protein